METRNSINIKEILNHPHVRAITDKTGKGMKERRNYIPPKCSVFSAPYTKLEDDDSHNFTTDKEAEKQLSNIINNKVQVVQRADSPDESLKKQYEKKRSIGIVFSGGPAPGGHNVIAGLYDAAKKANPDNQIYGFWMGPDGIIDNESIELTKEIIDKHRNTGGFSMIRTGRTKIDTAEKMGLAKNTCKTLDLNALIIVGGDDSNTNAAFLAQEMYEDGVQVIGVPKTIDGDIQVRDNKGKILCAMSFGFHSAARAFATSISNLCTDGNSDVKYWHICKVMGRVASHLALEVALQTHANMTFIGEDLANYMDKERIQKADAAGTTDYTAYGMTLRHLSRLICDGIVRRAAAGKNFGVLVIPEGILEFINEIQIFIIKLNTIIADYNNTHDKSFHQEFPRLREKMEYLRKLAQFSRDDTGISIWNPRDDELFNDIPDFFQEGLLMERDSHGNFPFSQVKTEMVLLGLIKEYLSILREKGIYKIGIKRDYFKKTIEQAKLDPDIFGQAIFVNYEKDDLLMVNPSIISIKTLKQQLVKNGVLKSEDDIPESIKKIYKLSVPNFKTQTHFYGYDGRGSNPTRFDCNYTYNLGQTVFSLVANGATGQMAAIKNLEQNFEHWEPIGIPIAPLMHLEERKGKLALVMEKSIVDLNSTAFRTAKHFREKWLAATPGEDEFRQPGSISLYSKTEEDHPITLSLNRLNCSE